MPENVESFKPGRLNFRLKILLALLGVILLMAVFLLIVLQRETSVQIEAAIGKTMKTSQNNFVELEQSWKVELAALCKRYAGSTRILGAFDAAAEEGNPAVLAEAAAYETKLAAISGYLLLFSDLEGRVICALLDGRRMAEAKVSPWPAPGISEEEVTFGYTQYAGQLYAAHAESLYLFSRKIGYILIGFPLRETVVQDLGVRVEGQLCFVVGARAMVATPGIAGVLLDQMVAAAGSQSFKTLAHSGQTWALFSEFLNQQKPGEGSMVYAIPLARTLAPFERIRATLYMAAIAAMVAAVILGFFLSKGLSAPIHELVRGTKEVAHGNFDFRTHIASRDEIGVLGHAFNTMVHGLSQKEKYRNVLDKALSPEVAEEMLKGNLFLGGENRLVTTLFADIRGFSAMIEGMDPREVIALLNDYLEGASAAVEAEGGVVDKYVGDAIMAVFGAPVFHADDARRSVRAALCMQETILHLNESRRASGKPRIVIGIGISTGVAVAGNMGSTTRLNYTVLGEPVNLAARLCSRARAGEILISASTLDAAGPELDTQALEPVSLKGMSNPVPIWLVKGLRAL